PQQLPPPPAPLRAEVDAPQRVRDWITITEMAATCSRSTAQARNWAAGRSPCPYFDEADRERIVEVISERKRRFKVMEIDPERVPAIVYRRWIELCDRPADET